MSREQSIDLWSYRNFHLTTWHVWHFLITRETIAISRGFMIYMVVISHLTYRKHSAPFYCLITWLIVWPKIDILSCVFSLYTSKKKGCCWRWCYVWWHIIKSHNLHHLSSYYLPNAGLKAQWKCCSRTAMCLLLLLHNKQVKQ